MVNECKTCMVTGHRSIELSKYEYVKQELRREIVSALEEGYIHFISGFAEGVDLVFADIIAEFKNKYPVTLKAVIPYRKRMKTKNKDFQRLLSLCDSFIILTEEYSSSCFMKRNRFMVQSSDRIIAVYDGRGRSGTLATMCYAGKQNKEIKIISI